ncbi:MAG: hypothetical protein ACPGVI_06980 [Crocinitomicaceae bacterium]
MNAKNQLNGKLFVDRASFFNLLAGNSTLLKQVESGMSEDEIRATWKEGLDQFSEIRSKYLMYE